MPCGRMGDDRGARARSLFRVTTVLALRSAVNRSAIERTIEAVWHMESAKIIAKLARMLRNVGLAEEIAQDAWVAALEQWTAAAFRRIRARGSWRPRRIEPLISCGAGSWLERKSAVMTHDPDLLGQQ